MTRNTEVALNGKLPDRIAKRPDPHDWDDDELLTLPEAAALLWPDGPLTEASLRTAVRDGRLPISRVAGKFLVTKRALKCLTMCEKLPASTVSAECSEGHTDGYQLSLKRIRAMRNRSNRD